MTSWFIGRLDVVTGRDVASKPRRQRSALDRGRPHPATTTLTYLRTFDSSTPGQNHSPLPGTTLHSGPCCDDRQNSPIHQRTRHRAHRDRAEHGRDDPPPLLHRLNHRDHHPGEHDQCQQPHRLPPADRREPDPDRQPRGEPPRQGKPHRHQREPGRPRRVVTQFLSAPVTGSADLSRRTGPSENLHRAGLTGLHRIRPALDRDRTPTRPVRRSACGHVSPVDVGLPGQRLTLPPAAAGRRQGPGCWERSVPNTPDPRRSGCWHVAAEERDQPDDRRGGVGDVPGWAETAAAGTYCSPVRAGEGQ